MVKNMLFWPLIKVSILRIHKNVNIRNKILYFVKKTACIAGKYHNLRYGRLHQWKWLWCHLEIELTTGVTGWQGMLTPPRHLIPPLIYSEVHERPFSDLYFLSDLWEWWLFVFYVILCICFLLKWCKDHIYVIYIVSTKSSNVFYMYSTKYDIWFCSQKLKAYGLNRKQLNMIAWRQNMQ
jgi:hypothetical protein